MRPLAILLVPLAALAALAADAPKPVQLRPAELRWVPGPVPNTEMALLEGSPNEPGPFTMRLRVHEGFKLAPHWHPQDERATVISGVYHVGFGDLFDRSKAKRLEAGSYFLTPAPLHHFAFADEEAIIQISSVGPFETKRVAPPMK